MSSADRALLKRLDDLRRAAMGKPAAEGIFNPADAAKKVAAGVREAGQAIPTIAIILGLVYLAHKFGDDGS